MKRNRDEEEEKETPNKMMKKKEKCTPYCQRRQNLLKNYFPQELIELILVILGWDPYHLAIDDILDAKDYYGQQYASIVKGFRYNNVIQVQYMGWPKFWNEEIEIDSGRLSELKCSECTIQLNSATIDTNVHFCKFFKGHRMHCHVHSHQLIINPCPDFSYNYCCYQKYLSK